MEKEKENCFWNDKFKKKKKRWSKKPWYTLSFGPIQKNKKLLKKKKKKKRKKEIQEKKKVFCKEEKFWKNSLL